jgi:Xaa-Pro dipeptidase
MARDERLERTLAAMAAVDADLAVLTSVGALAYVGGCDIPIETGPSPFAGAPATLVVTREGELTLVATNTDVPGTSRVDAVRSYPGLSRETYAESLAEQHLRALAEAVPGGRPYTVAVERDVLPLPIASSLQQHHRLVDIGPGLVRARATKTAAEVEQLRSCARIVDAGLRAARTAARPGRTELEVFADVRCAMETALDGRTPVGGDLLTGERTIAVMGPPTTRVVRSGDIVLCDLVPRQAGYWGDGCATFCVDETSASFRPLYDACAAALDTAADVLRPGISAGDLDQALRGTLAAHGFDDPIHMGHAIGVAVHEHPRIVPGEPATLEAGMVLMLEPCVSAPRIGGARLEQMFHVTATGNERLSEYELEL